MRTTASFCLVAILLLVALVRFYPYLERGASLRGWGVPRVAKAQSASNRKVKVWVNTRSGFYYCRGTRWYGKIKPGAYMTQDDALQRGYRSVSSEVCQ